MQCESDAKPLPYGRQCLDEEDIRAVVEALRSDWLTTGPRLAEFERSLAEATGARHAVAVSSGTAALHLAYAACGVGEGDEVVTTPNTFVATANAAAWCGADVRLADIDPLTRNIDPAAAAAAVGERTRALVAVDFAGHPADWGALRRTARERGVKLIADACHSLGASAGGRAVGTLADATCFSFHPVKSITTGEGGAVVTDDDEIAERCRRGRHHGVQRDVEGGDSPGPWYFEMQELGLNYRLTDFQAALGTSQLRKLDGFVTARARLAGRYTQRLASFPGVRLPREEEGVRSAWHLYAIEVPARERLRIFRGMREAGIGVQVHYIPVHHHPYWRRRLTSGATDLPRCEEYYARAISLPLYPGLADGEQDRVVDTLRRLWVE